MRVAAILIAAIIGLVGPGSVPAAMAAEAKPSPQLAVDFEQLATDLTDQTMQVFVEGIRKHDLRGLLELASSRFKASYTPDDINAAFRSFAATVVTGDPLADQSPAFLVPPAIEDGLLRVQGLYELPDGLLLFDLAFAAEEGDWKLDGIDVRSQPVGGPAASAAQQE